MSLTWTRWVSLFTVLLLATLSLPGSGDAVARAQGATFDCPAPAAASASPVAGPAEDAAASAVFPEGGGELTVFAAASLTDAFARMENDLEATHPELRISFNFAGSQALVTQLNEGAAADVFAAANAAQMTAAVENGSIAGEPVTFVHNELAIVTPVANPAGIAAPADLATEGLRLVLAQAEVPVGRYSREAVCKMGQDSAAYGDDFVARVAGNVVSEEEDVRDVLAKVVLGEADAGIVYVSDAVAAGDQVLVVDIPDEVNVIATYPVAILAGGDEALGSAFVSYLLNEEGQAMLQRYGFQPAK